MDYKKQGNVHCFWFDTNPVPASRPRVSRWGTYYAKTYKAFRVAFALEVAEFRKDFRPLLGERLKVKVVICCKRPKTTKLPHPRGDIDNYLKALFDSCNEFAWRDDIQIQEVWAHKQWSEGEGYISMDVEELPNE